MTEGRIIAIGDIHGCSAALAALVRAIDPTALDTLVFLGDYIDRGPDSRGVLEQVLVLPRHRRLIPLLGNHEEMLLKLDEKSLSVLSIDAHPPKQQIHFAVRLKESVPVNFPQQQ